MVQEWGGCSKILSEFGGYSHKSPVINIPQRITLYLGGRSFCRIESCRFPVRLLHLFPSVFWVGQIMVLFLSCCFNIPFCFWGVVLFVKVWRDFLQRPNELIRALWAGWFVWWPPVLPFVLSVEFLSDLIMKIGCWIICRFLHIFVVGAFVGSDSSCSLVRSVTGSDQKLDDPIKRSSYDLCAYPGEICVTDLRISRQIEWRLTKWFFVNFIV